MVPKLELLRPWQKLACVSIVTPMASLAQDLLVQIRDLVSGLFLF